MPEAAAAPAKLDRAVLWVGRPALLWRRAGGMTVLERQLFTAARAGLKSVLVGTSRPDEAALRGLRLPPGLEVRWAEGGTGVEPPYLGLSSDHFLRVEALAEAVRTPYERPLSLDDASGSGVIQATPYRQETAVRDRRALPADACVRLDAAGSAEVVEWLMASGRKGADGFMARVFDRRISMSVSRALLDTPVTPNMMTLASSALGVVGALLFCAGPGASSAAGALLVWLHSVLDGCDGELARVRFQESAFGSDLDFWGDNVVHLVLFASLAVGLRAAGPHVAVLGAAACLTTAASAWTAWGHRLRRRAAAGGPRPETGVAEEGAGGGVRARLARLENALAQRDFIYLLIAAAFLGRTYEFLWISALGGVLFFAVMLYLRRVNQP